ncbi:MAG: cysteine dioxygenase family protein [Leptolyngbyaceae cyanobacterium MAG.088]|nr:cysteine dioxygenase family protein [Leptolyngbyaceae cyanobacterium MAG.088]
MTFNDLRTDIAHIKQACLSPEVAVKHLREILKQFVACTNTSQIKASFESQELYRRQQLSAPQDDFHIVMAVWKPNSSSPIHDHDNTTGAVITLVGETIETKYERVAVLGKNCLLKSTEIRVLDSKTVSPILPGGGLQLHAMHNPRNTWAATLHVYLHPLKTFNLYHSQAFGLHTQTSTDLWFDEIMAPFTTQAKDVPQREQSLCLN